MCYSEPFIASWSNLFFRMLGKEWEGENHGVVIWPGLVLTEMLLLHFFMGARCVWHTVDTILVCISLVHLQLCWLCWVQLKLQIKLSRPFKAEVLSQQSKMTWCLRCRWQVCSSSLPGGVRDCSSSPRSSYLRESQQAILHWGNDSSFKRASSDLNASDCLGTIQRTFVLRWVDPVQTVISLQRVSYSKENNPRKNLVVMHAAFWEEITYESVGREQSWKVQRQHATKNGIWPLSYFP